MISLNKSISFASQEVDTKLTPTRYYEFFPLDKGKSLLLHLLTGAVDMVAAEENCLLQKMFNGQSLNDLPDDFRVILEKRGYLSNPKIEQIFIDDLAEHYQKQIADKPLEFFVCTSFTCPVGCTYCFEGELMKNRKNAVINKKQIDSVFSSIESIKTTQNRPIKELVLFGGEPLLPTTMNVVRQILEHATKRHYKVSICTSGVFADKFISIFRGFTDTISVVRITIDGPQKYHDALRSFPKAFDKAVSGIVSLLDIGIKVITRTNVGKQNLEIIPNLSAFFMSQGWMDNENFEAIVTGIKNRGCYGDSRQILREDELAVRFLEMRARYEAVRRLRPVNIFMSLRHLATNLGHLEGIIKTKQAGTPLETIKFHSCGAIDGTLYIFGVDNNVYTCTETVGKPKFAIGQYHPSGLKLNSTQINKWQGWYKYRIPKCRQCKYLLICGGTCTMTSVMKLGSGKEPVCPPISQILGGYISALSQLI